MKIRTGSLDPAALELLEEERASTSTEAHCSRSALSSALLSDSSSDEEEEPLREGYKAAAEGREYDGDDEDEDAEVQWEEVWDTVEGPEETSFHSLRIVAPGGDFALHIPPISDSEQLEFLLNEAHESMSRFLQRPAAPSDSEDEDALQKLLGEIRRSQLLRDIREYKSCSRCSMVGNYAGMLRWNADGWGITFNSSGESCNLGWFPIYNTPSTDTAEENNPGPSNQPRPQRRRRASADQHSGNLERRRSSRKRKRESGSARDSSDSKRRRPNQSDSDSD